MADQVDDEELAKKLQAEIDSQYASIKQTNAHYEVSDAELAKRLQEEADLEAQFERATADFQAQEQAKALVKQEAEKPVKG